MQSTAVKSYALDLDWSAQTMLPIELEGAELQLEARAYQGSDPRNQAFVLINRPDQASSKDPGKESGQLPLVRVHSGCITGDIFHSLKCDCYPQLQASLKKIVNAPIGILIYLPYHEGRGIGLVAKIRAYALQEQGYDTVDANVAVGAPIEAREYDLAAHILFDLGYPEIKLLSNNPAKSEALRAEGIKVTETVPVITKPNVHNVRYLETKRARMSHRLPSQISALVPAVAQPAE
jgi:GTP cyclohydrolase II